MQKRPEPPKPPSAPQIPPLPDDVPRALLAPVASVDLADHGRTLRLRLAGAERGPDVRAYVRDSDPVVVIVHRLPDGDAAAEACPGDIVATIELAQPLGDRTVIDAATGRAVPVHRPA